MPEPKVRLQDVADEAGLSKAAASYALRGLKGSAATQERVRDVADRLGYSANPAAAALAAGRTGAVGVCGSLGDPWHQAFAVRLAGRLREQGMSSSIADTDADPEREREVVQAMARDHLDGVIALVGQPAGSWWGELPETFSVVSVGDDLPARPEASCVVFDNVHGVRTALEHLAGLGHRRVALLTTTMPASPGRPAETVAAAYAAEAGLDLTVLAVPPSSRAAVDPVRDLVRDLVRGADHATGPASGFPAPTALFCLSDAIAFAAYRAAAALGLQVPQDISILGYDDHDLADLVTPALTTFGWEENAIVDAAIGHLTSALDGRQGGRSTFRPELVLRASTAAPARG